MNKPELIKFLKYKAFKLRYFSVISTTQAGSGHMTSSLSAADLVAALFFYAMQYDPKNSKNPNNDRFILSKGHAAPVLYAAWQQAGALTEEDLLTLRDINSVLEGHPTPRFEKVEAATGSLGQGLSVGVGIAMSAKLDSAAAIPSDKSSLNIKNAMADKSRNFYTYVLIGDSECSEGQIWEAAEIAAYYKLDNLIAILDVNKLGQTGETMFGHDLKKYEKKFKAFGWDTTIINGHDIKQILTALDKVKKSSIKKPKIIIAKTIKGYGIKSIEGKNGWHGKAISHEELPKFLDELYKKFPKEAQNKGKYNWMPKLPKNTENTTSNCTTIKLPSPNYKLGDKIATRKAYGEALVKLADICPELLSLDAEVQNSTFAEILEKKYPGKFIQCFIAEQNMISMAVGLTTQNKITFSSTFACFLTRAFDQIRMAAISQVPLRLCGSHAGVSIGQDGPSQMGLEDIAMLRAVPNSIIFYPSDAVSTYKLIEQMANYNSGISYLRTTRSETNVIYNNSETFKIGGCKILKQSDKDKVCIIAAGITLHEALKAYEQLKKEKISVSIIDLYSIKPIDKETIIKVANKSENKIITVEDHYLEGGLGEAVTYELKNTNIKIECLAVTKLPRSGKTDQLLAFENIDANAIIRKVKKIV